MSVDITSWIWNHSTTKGSKRLVLLSLADNANDQGYCWPSIPTIAERCQLTERYIQGILKDLEEAGHIEIIRRFDDDKGLNKSNLYRVITSGTGEAGSITPGELEFTTPGESQFTTPGEAEFTRMVRRSSPEPSFNRNLEPSEGGEEEVFKQLPLPTNPKEAAEHPDIQIFKSICDRIPGEASYRTVIDTIQFLRTRYSSDEEMITAIKPFWLAWDGRKTNAGKPYSKSSIAWLTEWAINGEIPKPSRKSQDETYAAIDEAARQLELP